VAFLEARTSKSKQDGRIYVAVSCEADPETEGALADVFDVPATSSVWSDRCSRAPRRGVRQLEEPNDAG
jgi:hypothetical protein